jgi:hypothetical protein
MSSTNSLPASTPSKHWVEVKKSHPSDEAPEIFLHTTYAGLATYRHRGFLGGDTLTAKALHELAEVRRRHFIYQKVDLNGQATKPLTDNARDDETMIASTEILLDLLGQMEKFIHAPKTPENKEALENAIEAYHSKLRACFYAEADRASHGDIIGSAIVSTPGHKKFFTSNALLSSSFDATGPESLGEKIRDETLRVLSCLNSYHFLHSQEKGHLLRGFAQSAIKKALQAVQLHDFSLTTRAKLQRDLLPTPAEIHENPDKPITISIEPYLNETQKQHLTKSVEHLQRFSNYLNHGEPQTTLAPLSQFRSFLATPVLWWRRHTGVNHESNHFSGLKYLALLTIQALAILGDNLGGLVTGIFQKNFTYFRKKANKFQFSNQPQNPAALLEWKIRTQLSPTPTLLNSLSTMVSAVSIQIGSAVIYGLKTIAFETINLFTDNYFIQKIRGILSPEKSTETELLNLLKKLENRTMASLSETHPTSPDSSEAKEAPEDPEATLRMIRPSDHYRTNDLFGLSGQAIEGSALGLSRFMTEYPAFSLMIALSFGLAASPTIIQSSLNLLIKKIDTPTIANHIAGWFPKGAAHDYVKTLLNNYVFSRLRIADAAALANFDLDQFTDNLSAIQPPKFHTSIDAIQQKTSAMASKAEEDASHRSLSRSKSARFLSATPLTTTFAGTPKKAFLPIPESAPSPPDPGHLEPQGSAHGSPRSPAAEPLHFLTHLFEQDRVAFELLKNFDQLPSLGPTEKSDLCRYVLKKYPHQKSLTDCIIQQTLKEHPLKIKNFTLPESALSRSLVHAIQYAFNIINMIFSVPRFLIDLIRRHQSSLSKRQLRTTKMLLIESGARVGSALGGMVFGISRMIFAGIKVPLGAIDQGITFWKFLTQKIGSSKLSFSTTQHNKKIQKTTSTVVSRASFSASMDIFLNHISSRLSVFLKLKTAQKITQGQKTFKSLVLKTTTALDTHPSSQTASAFSRVAASSQESESRTQQRPHGNKVSPLTVNSPTTPSSLEKREEKPGEETEDFLEGAHVLLPAQKPPRKANTGLLSCAVQ